MPFPRFRRWSGRLRVPPAFEKAGANGPKPCLAVPGVAGSRSSRFRPSVGFEPGAKRPILPRLALLRKSKPSRGSPSRSAGPGQAPNRLPARTLRIEGKPSIPRALFAAWNRGEPDPSAAGRRMRSEPLSLRPFAASGSKQAPILPPPDLRRRANSPPSTRFATSYRSEPRSFRCRTSTKTEAFVRARSDPVRPKPPRLRLLACAGRGPLARSGGWAPGRNPEAPAGTLSALPGPGRFPFPSEPASASPSSRPFQDALRRRRRLFAAPLVRFRFRSALLQGALASGFGKPPSFGGATASFRLGGWLSGSGPCGPFPSVHELEALMLCRVAKADSACG